MVFCIVNSIFQTLVFVPREMKCCVCLAGDAISFHGLVFFCHIILLADGPRDRRRRINVVAEIARLPCASLVLSTPYQQVMRLEMIADELARGKARERTGN